jgi:hypothetical protein
MSFQRLRKNPYSNIDHFQSSNEQLTQQNLNAINQKYNPNIQNQNKPQSITSENRSISNSQNYKPHINRLHSNASVQSNQTTSTSNQLVCNDCINRAIQENKNTKPNNNYDYSKFDSPLDIQYKKDLAEKEKINNKINNRLKLTNEAGKNIKPAQNKNNLINEYENEKFYFHDDKKCSKDFNILNTMDKYNKTERLNKNRNLDKNKIDNFYDKYVDNYINEEKPVQNNKKENQKKYNKELEEQIKIKNQIDNDFNQREKNYLDKLEKEYYDKLNLNEKIKQQKLKDLNDDCLRTNKNMEKSKKNKNLDEKSNEINEEKLRNENDLKILQDENNRKDLKKIENLKGLKHDLDNQINEKEQQRIKELNENKKGNDYLIKNTGCECGKCSLCKNTYPLNMLTTKKEYNAIKKGKISNKE